MGNPLHVRTTDSRRDGYLDMPKVHHRDYPWADHPLWKRVCRMSRRQLIQYPYRMFQAHWNGEDGYAPWIFRVAGYTDDALRREVFNMICNRRMTILCRKVGEAGMAETHIVTMHSDGRVVLDRRRQYDGEDELF